jgi:hypothetical protein
MYEKRQNGEVLCSFYVPIEIVDHNYGSAVQRSDAPGGEKTPHLRDGRDTSKYIPSLASLCLTRAK